MTINALWCHPRSVSTAFERIMRERGDVRVFHEPFMYHHYLTTTDRLFPGFEPEPGHPTTYAEIRDMIRSTAQHGPVFFKDMAYYVAQKLPGDIEFAQEMTHAFLVRDPSEAALSYARKDPHFTLLELGVEAQYSLFCALLDMGHDPLVITADQLRSEPEKTLARYWRHVGLPYMPHAFRWDDQLPEDWESVQSWHQEVMQSGAIRRPQVEDVGAQLEALGEPYAGYAAHHRAYYEKFVEIAESQLHQK